MIDVKLIVEDTETVRKALSKRLSPDNMNLESIVSSYEEVKKLKTEFEVLRANQNSYNDKMAQVKKGSEEFLKLVAELKDIAAKVKEKEQILKEKEDELKAKVEVLPNIPDEDVPAGEKESNTVVAEFGEKIQFGFKPKDHVAVAEGLGLVDFERAAKMAGAQFSMYVGDGARLEWALINFFIDQHIKDGYTMIMPPHLLLEESAYTAGQLPKFREDVYWVQDGNCLLPTAETALANIYRNEILDEKDLPRKLFAYTPCYRREAGSYRSNERGLMRMHQFNKVEMFQYTTQEGSKVAFDELVEKACDIVKQLGLHFRVSKLAAGDCSAGAARTHDVEVWFPVLGQYYEVSSVSNVTDYQARRGNIRYKSKDDGKTKYVHMLNGSGLATSRLMVSLLETYQNEDGSLTVPEVLRKYVGKERITVK